MMMKKKQISVKKIAARTVTKVPAKRCSNPYKFPDLTDFRNSIHIKGEPLSQVIIKGRG